MSKFNVNDVLGKLNELKAVFVLGQRAVPFIEEVFVFLKDVAPLLEEINASMMDSALKMPHATSQLQSISNATKTASAEILDLIDEVLVKSQTYEGSLEQTLHDARSIEHSDDRLMALLRDKIGDREDVLTEVEALMADRREAQHSIEGSVHARRTVVEELQSQMNRIGNSLQVQDITTQQIASVTHLLDTMRVQMSTLLERLDAHQQSPVMVSGGFDIPADADFDPYARFDRSDDRQQAVDDVFRAAALDQSASGRPGATASSAAASTGNEDADAHSASRQDDGASAYDAGSPARVDVPSTSGDGVPLRSDGALPTNEGHAPADDHPSAHGESSPSVGDDEIERIFRSAAMAVEARRRQHRED